MEVKDEKKRAYKICMLSGKGGCGKTTISLVLSKLFASCGKKVLLVDCDLATHGASCFLCDQLRTSGTSKRDIAFINNIIEKVHPDKDDYKLLGNEIESVDKIISVSDIYFLPYNIFQKENKPIVQYTDVLEKIIHDYLDIAFDIIIFDCQAGYNVLSKKLASLSDNVLFLYDDDIFGETAMDLIRGRLIEDVITKPGYLILNKCADTTIVEPRYNRMFKSTAPIRYNKQVGHKFTVQQFIELDFKGNYGTCPDFLHDVICVAEECFSEYHEIYQIKSEIERYFEYLECEERRKKLKKRFVDMAIYGGVILFLIIIFIVIIGLSNYWHF